MAAAAVGLVSAPTSSGDARYVTKEAIQVDMDAARREYLFRPPAALGKAMLGLIADPRDEPLLLCLFNISVTVLPAAISLFFLPPSHLLGAAYLVLTYVVFAARFILAFHYSAHRRLFSQGLSLSCSCMSEFVILVAQSLQGGLLI